jgi:hypothetical protein
MFDVPDALEKNAGESRRTDPLMRQRSQPEVEETGV